MATSNPRIAYDVVANAQGEQDVARLAAALEKVDNAIDPVAAQRAKELATELQRLGAQRTAIDTFVDLKNKAETARSELEQLQQQTQKLGREIANTEKPTRAQSGEFQKLKDATRAAKSELQAQVTALDQSRAALTRLGIATDGVASAQVKVRSQIAETTAASQQLVQRYQQTASAAEQAATKQVTAQQKVADSVGAIGNQLRNLQGLAAAALGGSFVGQIAGDVAKTADEYNNLAARIRLVTGEGAAFERAFQGVFDIATRTGASLESTGNLFTRIAQAGKDIGFGNEQALALTETINQAIQLSGASAQSADAAIVQLVQGLQAGVLRGEEFNSVMEQSPRLARALADGLGVTTGELRKLAQQGALTSEVVIKALQGQANTLRTEFDKLPPTVGRALQNLSTEWRRYIGAADQGSGASITAAKAIDLLGQNIGTLASLLKVAGEAWLAYKALDLATVLLRQTAGLQASSAAVVRETAAVAADTAAKAANTAATTANTAAVAANAAARTGATAATTAGAGALLPTLDKAAGALSFLARFGGVFTLLATGVALFGDVFISTFRKIGTAIGEGGARLGGYKDRSDEVLANQQAMDEAARAAAAAQAAHNQQLQQAADKALGLSDAAKALVADFDDVEKKGGTTAQALEKITKALDLGNVQGIQAAGAALDALALKGKISADQIRQAFAQALKGEDLAIFEAQARAAFDGSEQGARRLKAAIDAIGEEALRRAGSSLEELATGFTKASASAINDVDALVVALRNAGARADDTGRLLAGALDKALSAANTERAVQAVIDRLTALGKQGTITGEQLAEGLDKARKKIDELKPGINSLDEALRAFGLKTQAELDATATKLGEAYRRIANDVSVSLADKAKAFEQYAAAATAANKGVETGEVALQRAILDTKLAASGLGSTIVDAMGKAAAATQLAAQAQERYNQLLQADPSRLAGGAGLGGIGGGGSPGGGGTGGGTGGGDSNRRSSDPVPSRTAGGQITPPESTGQWEFDVKAWQAAGSPVFQDDKQDDIYWRRKDIPTARGGNSGFGGPAAGRGSTPAPGPAPSPPTSGPGPAGSTGGSGAPAPAPAGGTLYTIRFLADGIGSADLNTTSGDAGQFIALVERARRRAGG